MYSTAKNERCSVWMPGCGQAKSLQRGADTLDIGGVVAVVGEDVDHRGVRVGVTRSCSDFGFITELAGFGGCYDRCAQIIHRFECGRDLPVSGAWCAAGGVDIRPADSFDPVRAADL